MSEHSDQMSRQEVLKAEIAAFQQRHSELKAELNALLAEGCMDMFLIAKMKREKLALKDEIARLQDQVVPDIIA